MYNNINSHIYTRVIRRERTEFSLSALVVEQRDAMIMMHRTRLVEVVVDVALSFLLRIQKKWYHDSDLGVSQRELHLIQYKVQFCLGVSPTSKKAGEQRFTVLPQLP